MGGLSPVYDLVGTVMRAFTSVAFDVRLLGGEHLAARRRMIMVVTHRSDHDVPIVCGQFYFSHRWWRKRDLLPHFAVRDDLFLPGFFAGYPPWPRRRLRRLLWPIGVGGSLRRIRCHPIRSSHELRLVEVFRSAPDLPIRDLAPPDAVAALAAHGIEPRRPAREALVGDVGDVLWRAYGADALSAPAHQPLWHERRRAATDDFRALVDVLSGDGVLMLFPEGRPSPDGQIGPLRPGLGALVRRAKPDWLLTMALAYDPLGPGRTRVHVAVAAPAPPPARDVEEEVLGRLRRTMPLTVGQIAARIRLGEPAPQAEDDVAAALAEGRPVERDLLDPAARAERLRVALAYPAEEATLRRLAREYASARETQLVAAR